MAKEERLDDFLQILLEQIRGTLELHRDVEGLLDGFFYSCLPLYHALHQSLTLVITSANCPCRVHTLVRG